MDVDQEPRGDDPKSKSPDKPFRFLLLPLELRLKIYNILLPPLHHKIARTTKSFSAYPNVPGYPFSFSSSLSLTTPTRTPTNLTTGPHTSTPNYALLTQNFRTSYPHPTAHVQILRASKQLKSEAEPVLYGGKGVIFDFGTSVECVKPFFSQRSQLARDSVREIRLAREAGIVEGKDGRAEKGRDGVWFGICGFVCMELKGLRVLDLKLWSSNGRVDNFPVSLQEAARVGKVSQSKGIGVGDFGHEGGRVLEMRREVERKWKEWEWTKELLGMEGLREGRITWWGFLGEKEGSSGGFDGWLAGRMVADGMVRDRMIREGLVIEGVVGVSCGV